MAKKGKLSEVEKAAIRTLSNEKMELSSIASTLDRTEKTILNYQKTLGIEDIDMVVVTPFEKTSENVVLQVTKMLKTAGMINNDVDKLVNGVIKKSESLNINYNDEKGVQRMYKDCISSMKAGSFMIKKSIGGNGGVAIMTAASSQRNNNMPQTNNIMKNTYRPFK